MLLFIVIEMTLLMTVSGHQAVNPLTDNAGSEHQHQHHVQMKQHHEQKPQQQQQQQHGSVHPAAAAHGHGFDRNAVHNQQ